MRRDGGMWVQVAGEPDKPDKMPWLLLGLEHMLYLLMHSEMHSSRICAEHIMLYIHGTHYIIGRHHSLSIIILSNKTECLLLGMVSAAIRDMKEREVP